MPAYRLQQQLAGLHFPLDDKARTDVQRCVCEYVDAMKAEQCPPERMLVGLKRIAADADLSTGSLAHTDARESRANLLMDMVAWSIARYYGMEERS